MKKKLITLAALSFSMLLPLVGCNKNDEPSQPTDKQPTTTDGVSTSQSQPVEVSSVSVKNENKELNLQVDDENKKTGQIQVEVLPINAANDLTYTSQDEKIATVSQTGLVTAVYKGETKITVSSTSKPEIKDEIKIVVTDSRSVVDRWSEKLTKEIKYSGTYTVTSRTDTENHDFTIAFSNEKYYQLKDGEEHKYEKHHSDGLFDDWDDGKAVQTNYKYDNTIGYEIIKDTDIYQTPLVFDDNFKNPLSTLTNKDYKVDDNDEDKFTFVNPSDDLMKKIFRDMDISTLNFKDNKGSLIGEGSGTITTGGRNLTTSLSCTFTFGEEAFESLQPKKENKDTAVLKTVFENMSKVEQYTINETYNKKETNIYDDFTETTNETAKVYLANKDDFKARITTSDGSYSWATFSNGENLQFTYDSTKDVSATGAKYDLSVSSYASDITSSLTGDDGYTFRPVYDLNSNLFVLNSDGSFSLVDDIQVESRQHLMPSTKVRMQIIDAERNGDVLNFKIVLDENKQYIKSLSFDYDYKSSSYPYNKIKGSYSASYDYSEIDYFSKFNFDIMQFNEPFDSDNDLIGSWSINKAELTDDDPFKTDGLDIEISSENSTPVVKINNVSINNVIFRNYQLSFVYNGYKFNNIGLTPDGYLHMEIPSDDNQYIAAYVYELENKAIVTARESAIAEIEKFDTDHKTEIDALNDESNVQGQKSDKEIAADLKQSTIDSIRLATSTSAINKFVNDYKYKMDRLFNGQPLEEPLYSEEITFADDYYGKWELEDPSSLQQYDDFYNSGLEIEVIKVDDTHSAIKINNSYATDISADPSSINFTLGDNSYCSIYLDMNGKLTAYFTNSYTLVRKSDAVILDGNLFDDYVGTWNLTDASKSLLDDSNPYKTGLTIVMTNVDEDHCTIMVNDKYATAVDVDPSGASFTVDGEEWYAYIDTMNDNCKMEITIGDDYTTQYALEKATV